MDRRRERRLSVELPGSYRSDGTESRDIYYSQISANGCRLTGVRYGLRVGDVIELSLGPIGPMDATVRWTRDNLAGVEFHVALDAAVVSYFEAFIPAAA